MKTRGLTINMIGQLLGDGTWQILIKHLIAKVQKIENTAEISCPYI